MAPVALTVLCLLLLSDVACSPADGRSVVIGSPRVSFAAPGDDVILPCRLEPPLNVEALTVEWAKPDLKPDPSDPLSRVEYVHLYRSRAEVVDMKLASYVRRTQLFTDELRRGNLSLKIFNVTLADTGRYRCFIPKLQSRGKDAIVELVVDPNLNKTSTEMPLDPRNLQTSEPEDEAKAETDRPGPSIWLLVLPLSVLLLGGVAVAVYCYKQRRRKKPDSEYGAAQSKEPPLLISVSGDEIGAKT